jgi:cytochrome d ubiquinol oxidase subunit I
MQGQAPRSHFQSTDNQAGSCNRPRHATYTPSQCKRFLTTEAAQTELDATVLSRVQFGFTLAFHILFPTLTIGLAGFLVVLEGLWMYWRDELYLRLYRFWARIFALGFGMGVVSGVVLSFEFGTNFSRFSAAAGNVLGPLMSYEVLTAFFLEASFLPVMLFGWGRVSMRTHFFATLMVALGSVASAFWILAANSWMQTPAGYTLHEGIFSVSHWWAVIFNPSFPHRFAHMVVASYLSSAFVVAGVSAWHLLRGIEVGLARHAFSIALLIGAVAAPLQVVVGDLHGLQVLRDQPLKVAAMEGLWETTRGAPLVLFAVPDTDGEVNRYEIAVPKGASLILRHDPDGEVSGLTEVPAEDRPNVPVVFFSFRVMVAIGFSLVAVAGLGLWLRRKGRLYDTHWFLRLCVFASPLGFVAVIAGWLVAEAGRQPWVVYGMMRTAEGATPLPWRRCSPRWDCSCCSTRCCCLRFSTFSIAPFSVVRS